MNQALNMTDVVDQVIQYTVAIDNDRDYWQRASAMTGLLRWDRPESVAAVQKWLNRAIETQTSEGHFAFSEPETFGEGHAPTVTANGSLSSSFGYPTLLMYERSGEAHFLEAAERQIDGLMRVPRTKEGGFWSRSEGPELWIDWVYMLCPFLAKYGLATGQTQYIDEAFRQYEVHVRHLVDPIQKLARHAWREVPNFYPQSTLWTRGNGWLLAGGVDLLRLCPDHQLSGLVTETTRDVLTAMAPYQDRSGYFRHVLDDPSDRFEASGGVMFAYGAARAVEQGIVDESFLEPAVRAVRVVAGAVNDEGAVRGVSVPPGGPGVKFGTTPFGQGFFLQACDALRGPLELPAAEDGPATLVTAGS